MFALRLFLYNILSWNYQSETFIFFKIFELFVENRIELPYPFQTWLFPQIHIQTQNFANRKTLTFKQCHINFPLKTKIFSWIYLKWYCCYVGMELNKFSCMSVLNKMNIYLFYLLIQSSVFWNIDSRGHFALLCAKQLYN